MEWRTIEIQIQGVRMLSRKKMCLSAFTALFGATLAAPALAATGFYVGATAGQSLFHGNKSDFDAAIVDGFSVDGLSMHITSSSLDKTDFAYGALVGYRLTPEFSIEATYTDLGKLSYQSTGRLTSGPFFSTNATADLTGSAKGPTLAALGIVPLSGAWEIYGRAGLFFSKVTLDVNTDMNNSPAGPVPTTKGHSSMSADSVDPLVGIGAAWHMVNRLTLRAEYTRFVNVGDKDKTGEMNVDLFNVGVTYSLR
jgi:hypothetical protein